MDQLVRLLLAVGREGGACRSWAIDCGISVPMFMLEIYALYTLSWCLDPHLALLISIVAFIVWDAYNMISNSIVVLASVSAKIILCDKCLFLSIQLHNIVGVSIYSCHV